MEITALDQKQEIWDPVSKTFLFREQSDEKETRFLIGNVCNQQSSIFVHVFHHQRNGRDSISFNFDAEQSFIETFSYTSLL